MVLKLHKRMLNPIMMEREEKMIQVRLRRIIYPTRGTMRTEGRRRIEIEIIGPETGEKVAVVAEERNVGGMEAMTMIERGKINTGLRNQADHVMKAEKGERGKGLKKKMEMAGIGVQGLGRTLIGKARERREEGEVPVVIGVVIGTEAEKEIILIQIEAGETMIGIAGEKIMTVMMIVTIGIEVLIETVARKGIEKDMTIDKIETEVLTEMVTKKEMLPIETTTGAKRDH